MTENKKTTSKKSSRPSYADLEKQIGILKKEKKELIKRNEFFHKAIESLPHPFMIIDTGNYQVEYLNSAGGKIHGGGNRSCFAINHRVDEPCNTKIHPCPLELVKKSKCQAKVEHLHYDEEGKGRYFEVSGYPIFNEDGDFVKMIECAIDITDRKNAVEALRENEEKFREVFNNANDAIYLWDLQDNGMPGKCVEVNNRATKMLGYSREEFFEMTPGDIDNRESRNNIPDVMNALINNGQATFEAVHISKNGEKIPVEVSAHIFSLKDKKRILSITRDISLRKKMESELNEHRSHLERLVDERTSALSEAISLLKNEIKNKKTAERSLQQSQEELKDLYTYLQTVSENERKQIAFELHDHFGQYFSTILLMIQSVFKNRSFQKDELQEIEKKIGGLIDDLQELAYNLRPSILDDYGLDYALKRFLNETMKYAKINIDYNFKMPKKYKRLPGNLELSLYRIVQEAITNVLRHSNSDNVNVALSMINSKVALKIKDNGIGFDTKLMHNNYKNCLGLISMRERVTLLDGDFSIKSAPLKGTTINVKIPITGK
ncbi:PAS domain S-box protein [candidate division KSB1 bacterium]